MSTIIELEDKEAKLFLKFRQHQDVIENEAALFEWLMKYLYIWRKVFIIRNGSASLHLNSSGDMVAKAEIPIKE